MRKEELPQDLLDVLRSMKEKGGLDCIGGCRTRQPGEVHCQHIGPELEMSVTGVKERAMILLEKGLLNRARTHRVGSGIEGTKWTVTPLGEKVLERYDSLPDEKSASQ